MLNVILFIFTLFLSPFLAGYSQIDRNQVAIDSNYRIRKMPLFFSFFILAVILFLNKSGTDIKIYISYYSTWNTNNLFDLEYEFGFRLLVIFIRRFIADPYIGIGIIKIITLGIFYKTLILLKDKVDFTFSVFAYVTLLYIPSFHLLRMALAVSCVFYAFANEIVGNRKKTYFIFVIVFFLHYSSIFSIIAYIIYRIIRKKMKPTQTISLSLLVFLLPIFCNRILPKFVSGIRFFEKYDTYLDETVEKSSGMMQLIWFIPICVIILFMYREEDDHKLYTLGSVCGIMSFLVGTMGYYLVVASRSIYYFYFFIIIYCSSLKYKFSPIYFTDSYGRYKDGILYVGMFIYLIVHFTFELFIMKIFVSNGLMEYVFIWE